MTPLPAMMAWAKRAKPPEIREAAFVDAGFKDGFAEIGAVVIREGEFGPTAFAHSYVARCASSVAAEALAIELARDFAVEPDSLVIYTDNHSLACRAENRDRGVRWMPRALNVADVIANRRRA